MKWRRYILFLNIVLMTFIGVNAFAGADYNAGSVVPHFENSHSHSARYHGNHSQYLEDNSLESELDFDFTAEVQHLCFIPTAAYVMPADSDWLPRGPTLTEKRFLFVRSILI